MSTFYHLSQFNWEMIFFCNRQASFWKFFFSFLAFSHWIYVEPIFSPSRSFPWLSNECRQLLVLLLIDLRILVIFVLSFSSDNTCNLLLSNFSCYSFFMSKSPLLNFLNHWFSKSILSINFVKHLIWFCSSFL